MFMSVLCVGMFPILMIKWLKRFFYNIWCARDMWGGWFDCNFFWSLLDLVWLLCSWQIGFSRNLLNLFQPTLVHIIKFGFCFFIWIEFFESSQLNNPYVHFVNWCSRIMQKKRKTKNYMKIQNERIALWGETNKHSH